ncbi:ankyrin repeat-containing domain protein [Mycena vulgaris]|nr:ankyrin repeat-containing domain protein [Mycena vulgaris]
MTTCTSPSCSFCPPFLLLSVATLQGRSNVRVRGGEIRTPSDRRNVFGPPQWDDGGPGANPSPLSGPLWMACYNGHIEVVRILLEGCANTAESSPESCGKALHPVKKSASADLLSGALLAAAGQARYGYPRFPDWRIHRRIEIISLLLGYEADINAATLKERTALGAASAAGQLEVIRFLIDIGADIHAMSNDTALYAAAENGEHGIIGFLLDLGGSINEYSGPYGTALQVATSNSTQREFYMRMKNPNNERTVQFFIERGADVNSECYGIFGTTLEIAVRGGYKNLVKILLENSANIDGVKFRVVRKNITEILHQYGYRDPQPPV